jgi:hypothetical protein
MITRLPQSLALIALVAAGAMVAAGQGAWAADPVSAPRTSEVTASRPMHLAKAVQILGAPNAAGTTPVLLTDGSTIPVTQDMLDRVLHPTAAAAANTSADGVRPDFTVNGSCGSSNIYLHEKSDGHPVRMTTGFHIKSYLPPAVHYDWRAEIHRYNGGYDYYYHASGGLFFRYSWSGQHTSGHDYPTGYYSAAVDSGVATLSNGWICLSGDPYEPLTYL